MFRGQTFDFASEIDWYMKIRMHCKVCPNPPIRMPKKAMTQREYQNSEVEQIQRVHRQPSAISIPAG